MKCAWPSECDEKPTVRLQLLDYCTDHAAIVRANRQVAIAEFQVATEKAARQPARKQETVHNMDRFQDDPKEKAKAVRHAAVMQKISEDIRNWPTKYYKSVGGR